MICPRCKGYGVLVDRRASHLPTCLSRKIEAIVECRTCGGSGVAYAEDDAGIGTIDAGYRPPDEVAGVTILGRPFSLPATIAARRLDLVGVSAHG